MDPPTSNAQPSAAGRVMLPSIKNLVNALPPPNTYRFSSNQAGWNTPSHSLGLDASSAQSNAAHRNRIQALPPALQTPPPRHHHSDSPQTVTPSPSNIFSSASSGVSECSNPGDYVRPPAPTNVSGQGAAIQSTPRDARSNSPDSSGLTPFPGSYRSIRPSHSLVSQLPTMHQHQPPQHPRGVNLESRLPMQSSSGESTTSTSTVTPITARMNAAPVPNRGAGGNHRQNDHDTRTLPFTSDRQSHLARTYSPPSSGSHFLSPSSEHRLPPRNSMGYMHPQERYQRNADDRDDPTKGRSRSTSHASQYPPPTPPWERHNFQGTHRSSSTRELDPGDVRSRSTQQPRYPHTFNDSPDSAHSGSYRSKRTTAYAASFAPGESDIREDRMDGRTINGQGYSLRPARWVESGAIYGHKEMDPRRPDPPGQTDNAVIGRHGVVQHAMPGEDDGILSTQDRRYPPIQPAPSQQQRPYIAVDEYRARHPGITVRPSRYGAEAALGMSRDSMHASPPKHAAPGVSSGPFGRAPVQPPLPEGIIRHKSKEDLARVLQDLTQEANRAIAEGKAMKKISEFSKTIQQFARYQAQHPGSPTATQEDVEEISHRAVLIYRMAQAVKAKILAKKAAVSQTSKAGGNLPLPAGPQFPDGARSGDKKKKKPMTKEERQVMEDMERIRRKRTSAQQGIKSKYMKRNKKTLAPKQCASCNTKETPEWRKGPDGPRSLCNACGLHWAKLQRKRKEDGQWVGQGAPPPIDIITLRQVTGVGLQPRFNERGELEIPGTYINIPPNRPAFADIRRWKPPTPPGATSTSANEESSSAAGPSGNTAPSSIAANPSVQNSEGNNITIERLSMEDDTMSQPLQLEPPPLLVIAEPHEGRSKKRKASRDHNDPNGDDGDTAAPSAKKRRVASPIAEDAQRPISAEETVWTRAF